MYTNEELLERGNEMSLLMMFNKIQSAEDFGRLRQLPPSQAEKVEQIYGNAPEYLKDIIKDVVSSLMVKMNVPSEEADEYIRMMGENSRGYFFENMEKMDIQAERANTARAREDAQTARKDAQAAREDAQAAKQELAAKQQRWEMVYKDFISDSKKNSCSKEKTIAEIAEKFYLSPQDAKEKVEQYWEQM